MSYSSIVIKRGDKVFRCAHDQESGYHFFEVLEGESVVDASGKTLEGRWILLCNACFARAYDCEDPAQFITRRSEWTGDSMVFLRKEEPALQCSLRAVN